MHQPSCRIDLHPSTQHRTRLLYVCVKLTLPITSQATWPQCVYLFVSSFSSAFCHTLSRRLLMRRPNFHISFLSSNFARLVLNAGLSDSPFAFFRFPSCLSPAHPRPLFLPSELTCSIFVFTLSQLNSSSCSFSLCTPIPSVTCSLLHSISLSTLHAFAPLPVATHFNSFYFRPLPPPTKSTVSPPYRRRQLHQPPNDTVLKWKNIKKIKMFIFQSF